MLAVSEFYLLFLVVQVVTIVIVVSTLLYVVRIKMVRQKLKWILQVLTLLAVGMACETTIASVYLIAVRNKSVIGNVGISFLIILSVCGGVSVAQSFVIFALEYYKASYTIAFAKENRP